MLPTLTRDWKDETVFLVAGGSSVGHVDTGSLHGRRVVVVNSSYRRVPWADALVFTDYRWWEQHHTRVRDVFQGRVITVTPHRPLYEGLLVLERQRSGGLASDPTRLAWWHTTVTSAINMIVHRGARRICLLGVDGEGDWHHEPHPTQWGRNEHKFKFHGLAFESLLVPLAKRGVQVVNLNPDSKHRMFKFSTLDSELEQQC